MAIPGKADTIESAILEPSPPPSAGWRQSNWLAFAEFAIVALIFIADHRHLIPVSKTPFLLLLGWVSLRIRRVSWREVGLSRNRN